MANLMEDNQELADRLAALTPAQRALFELRLKRRESKEHQLTIPKRSQPNHCPLSLDQERLWFIHQLDPVSPAYNIYSAIRFKGRVDIHVLHRSLNEIVRRHEILRTSFATVDGKPVQIIAPHYFADIPVIDLGHVPPTEREAEAERLVTEAFQQPFDLQRLPLFRTTLIKLGDQDYVCPTVFHHIITDWVSTHSFDREMAVLYDALARGAPSPLPDLTIQYADFAIWQRERLNGQVMSAHLDYWREQLRGGNHVLDLPTDRPRPAVQTSRGFRQPLALSKAHSDLARTIAREEGVTVFMFFLAVFKLLLFRYTDQKKVIVGSPVANRNLSELQDQLGFFINQLVFCTDMSGNPTFRELLRRVREVALGAFAHQDLPFGMLVDALQPERDLSRTPLTQVVLLVLKNEPQGAIKFSGLKLAPFVVDGQSSKFDMTMSLWDMDEGFGGWVEYNTDLFDTSTIVRMTDHFRTLLAGIVLNPDQRLFDLPILTPSELHQMRVEWNDTEAEIPLQKCVHELFEAQTVRTPHATAVITQDGQLSYDELNRRSNQLAHRLQALGVGPEVLVGVLLDRSAESVVAMLGVLKAGGAFVPLDTEYPAERLAFIANDAGLSVLVTKSKLIEGAPWFDGAIVCLESESPITPAQEQHPVSGARPDNFAYVIYTSGSTGMPKGVMVEHRNLANTLYATQERFRFTSADTVSCLASFSFDISIFEWLGPLLVGGSCRLLNSGEVLDPAVIARTLEQVTIFHAVPSLMRQLVDCVIEGGTTSRYAQLRHVLMGGEAASPDVLQQALEAFPFAEVSVLYGPTEATIMCTGYKASKTSRISHCPLGRPFANMEMRVLDRWQNLVPIGVVGEIHIGGASVSRGYLKRADLTAERFVTIEGERYYRTGDLGRYLPDGNIAFVGRVDEQVKVRGYRIEPGEIETALSSHPAVSETVVLVREDGPGNQRLVAFVVPAAPKELELDELRRYLRDKLPEYMIPMTYTVVDQIPLTRNQKIDRQRLLSLEPNQPQSSFETPRTPAETTLAEIWRQVLRVEKISLDDNFFELGGDSILSIQIVARANRAGLGLRPKDIFIYQTLAELAAVAGTSEVTNAEQGEVTGFAPLTPIQRSFFELKLPEPNHFNQAVLLQVQPELDAAAWSNIVRHLLLHHDALRLRFVEGEGGWEQFHGDPGADAPLTWIDLSGLSTEEQGREIESRSAALQKSLDLHDGRVAQFAYFDLGGAKPDRLLVVVHHLVIDGVSWRILLEDLQTSYDQLSRKKSIALPPKTTSFKYWSERLLQYARSDEVAHEETYWASDSRRLVSRLPVDLADGANSVASAMTVETALAPEETVSLLQRVPGLYRTQINDVLLAALAQVFTRWTGDERVLIDVEGHGREELFDEVDLTRTVGWFTVRYPLLLEISNSPSVGESLRVVKEQLRELPRRGIGYGLLRYLGDETLSEKLGTLPQSEVVFNYLGQLDQAVPESSCFQPALEAPGPFRSGAGNRQHLLEIDGSVVNGRLRMLWTFSANLHRRETVQMLADYFFAAIRSIIAHCESDDGGHYTPSDFPLARLDQKELDGLIKTYQRIEDIYELSPVQQGMLFHTLSTPERGAYTEQVCVEIRGEIEADTFQQAWQQVVDRHTSLRTSFVWHGLARPLQIVHQRLKIGVDRHDWRALTSAQQQNHLEEFLEQDRRKGFDLSQPPMMRLTLIQLSADTCYFVWSHHHIIIDGWSLPLVVREVLQHYDELRSGRKPRTAAGRPYREYIRWLQTQDQSKVEAYWRRQLRGFSHPVTLSSNGERRGFAYHEEYGDEISHLSTTTSEALQALARNHQLTVNTIVQGAWALLLSLYSGRNDLVFGVTVSGRPSEIHDIETMVGLFINTLPVRVEVPHQTSVLDWLKEHQSRQSEMRQFEYCSLVQEWSEVPLGQPLFESLLVFENYPVDGSLNKPAGGLELRALRALVRTKYPITLVVAPAPVLSFYISYDQRRFEPKALKTMLAVLEQLLERIIANPSQLVSSVLDGVTAAPISKTDRQATTSGTRPSDDKLVAPQTPIEEILTGIWAEVLGINHLSIDDNFFDVGGHSLLATQILSRLRETFQIELSLHHVFESPTIAGLARQVGLAMKTAVERPYLPLKSLPRDRPLPLSMAQEPLWALDQAIPGTALFNIPVALRLEGQLNVAALEKSLGEIVRRHEVLRTTFRSEGELIVQVVNHKGKFHLSLVDIEEFPAPLRESEALRQAVEDVRQPFDLAAGPLLRINLLRLGKHEHWLTFTMHHIIADAWAAGVFARELAILYSAFVQGLNSPLPEPSIQYADFAHWQRECFLKGLFEPQLEYWRARLEGPLPSLNLPADRPRPENSNFRTASLTLNLPGDLCAAVKEYSRREGVSLFMSLLAAFQIVLFRYGGQEDARVGTLIANRNRTEIEGLFGLFVNTLILRTDLSANPTCRQALRRVRGVVLEAFNNQNLPFEQLVQVLERERGLDRTSLIEVLFILQNAPLDSLALPNLKVSHLQEVNDLAEASITLTMFDLILMMGEGPNGLTVSLKYKTELFDESTIEGLLRNFAHVLESMVLQSDQRLADVELPY